jgi:predicted Zn-dependent protease
MMSARAQVLANPGIDVLRVLSAQATGTTFAALPQARQVGVLYGAVMAEMKQRNFSQARQHLARLQTMSGLDAQAQRVLRLLTAELALAAGDAMQAIAVLEIKTAALTGKDRATRMLLAQSRVATHKPAQAKLAASDLTLWVNQFPRDASAWLVLSSAYDVQGDSLRSIRAQAEARAMELDYGAAVDRFKAAQQLAHELANAGKLDRAGHIEASIIDARLRDLQNLRREQALERGIN